jgi:Predicted transcriptional regulators containing the CopG/Arc/MetJ DNA-binding domain and a metal-binding domain
MSEEKVRAAFYGEKLLLDESDSLLAEANCKSRNEFINKAIRHYIAYLRKEDDLDLIAPALTSVLSATVKNSEDRIARLLFKLAVEMSMMLHVTASGSDISEKELASLRGHCVDEVKRLGGKISFDEAHKYQKG